MIAPEDLADIAAEHLGEGEDLLLRRRRLHHLLLAMEFVENHLDLRHARVAPVERDAERTFGEIAGVERVGLGDLFDLWIGREVRSVSLGLGPEREG